MELSHTCICWNILFRLCLCRKFGSWVQCLSSWIRKLLNSTMAMASWFIAVSLKTETSVYAHMYITGTWININIYIHCIWLVFIYFFILKASVATVTSIVYIWNISLDMLCIHSFKYYISLKFFYCSHWIYFILFQKAWFVEFFKYILLKTCCTLFVSSI